MSSIKIMVAAHKKFPMPENKNLYLPVLVGAKRNYKRDIYFQRDDEGENISEKNSNYNELTAIYWAWKNLKNVEAIGLVHYRRLFASDRYKNVPITKNEVEELLENNSVILPKKRKYYIETNYSHYIHAHKKEPLDRLRTIICDYYPSYLESFDKVMNRRSAHMFNMFIMKREEFNDYSMFIFGILKRLEEDIDISDFSVQEARVFGYLSELLMDVWIEKNEIKYSEVGWYQLGEKHTIKKIFYFICRKFGIGKSNTHF